MWYDSPDAPAGPPVTARRIMGTEVEYGISVPGDPTANPVITSTQVVLAYAAAADIPRSRRARWDYEVESPLRDARGFDLSAPTMASPNDSELDDLGAANVILTNGARLYVDHAHPVPQGPGIDLATRRDADHRTGRVVHGDGFGSRIGIGVAHPPIMAAPHRSAALTRGTGVRLAA